MFSLVCVSVFLCIFFGSILFRNHYPGFFLLFCGIQEYDIFTEDELFFFLILCYCMIFFLQFLKYVCIHNEHQTEGKCNFLNIFCVFLKLFFFKIFIYFFTTIEGHGREKFNSIFLCIFFAGESKFFTTQRMVRDHQKNYRAITRYRQRVIRG